MIDQTKEPRKDHQPPQPTDRFIIVGLGNTGRQYRENRHNIGFMTLDRLAERLNVNFRRLQHKALTTDGTYRDQRLVLAKPQTYMNNSGLAASGLVRFYKVPINHLMVIYDDLDLPLGTIRIRPKGGSGGQGGLRSIIDRLGGQDFPRMRLGIGRPPGTMDPANFVLHNFNADERALLPAILDSAVDAILTYVSEGIEAAMTGYNKQVI